MNAPDHQIHGPRAGAGPRTTAATIAPASATAPARASTTAPAAALRSAYELSAPTSRDDLVRVGRGTPMGELLRRYWHPVGLASDASATPRQIRALGEDLILFRTGRGEA